MSALRPAVSTSSLTSSITNCSPSSSVYSNTHSFPFPPPHRLPSSTASSAHPDPLPSINHGSPTSAPPSPSSSNPPQSTTPPQAHSRRPNSSNSPLSHQFLLLHCAERPPSQLTLTSTLAPPSVMPMTAAGISISSSTLPKRRSPAASLKLSMLPPSPCSTTAPPSSIAPTTSAASPPQSGYSYHQAYAHSLSAQHKLQLHQKEIISQATRAAGIPQHLLSTGPMSPRLIPLGSPGPVTPLTLEDNPSGFFAAHAGALEHQQLSQQLAIVASGGVMQS